MEAKEPLLVEKVGLPAREGVGKRELSPRDGPPYHAARVSKATGLRDLAEEYVLFSHGLLFTHGHWSTDPVVDYVQTQDPECLPFAIQLPRPVFSGLTYRAPSSGGDTSWNSILMAVLKEHWPGLLAYMGNVSGIDRKAKRYCRLAVQQMPVADVLALEKAAMLPDPLPMVDVFLFALDGSWATVGFDPAVCPPVGKVKVVKRYPPDPDVVKMAKAIFAEQEKPFLAVEPSLEEAKRKMQDKPRGR
jgi:hypothetical protein